MENIGDSLVLSDNDTSANVSDISDLSTSSDFHERSSVRESCTGNGSNDGEGPHCEYTKDCVLKKRVGGSLGWVLEDFALVDEK